MGWGLEHNPSEKFGLCDRLLQLFFPYRLVYVSVVST